MNHRQFFVRLWSALLMLAGLYLVLCALVYGIEHGAGRHQEHGPAPAGAPSASPFLCQIQNCTPTDAPVWKREPDGTR